jgi:hypothetical protein
VLGRIFGPKRDEITEKWSKLLNEELNDLYASINIIRVINSKTFGWAEHVQGGSNMTGIDLCVNCTRQSRPYLNHLVLRVGER